MLSKGSGLLSTINGFGIGHDLVEGGVGLRGSPWSRWLHGLVNRVEDTAARDIWSIALEEKASNEEQRKGMIGSYTLVGCSG